MSKKVSKSYSDNSLCFARTSSRFVSQVMNAFGVTPLTVLIYHRVLSESDPLRPGEPSAAEFEREMRILSECFNPIPMVQALQDLQYGTLPKRAVSVTFDDGYSDNEKLALPILEKYRVPATVFVSTGYLNGGRMWNDTVIETVRLLEGERIDFGCFEMGVIDIVSIADKVSAIDKILKQIKYWDPKKRQASVDSFQSKVKDLPNDFMLSDTQLRNMYARGVSIGGHTRSHPILGCLSDEEAMLEIVGCKQDLEARIDGGIESFAYPNGKLGVDFDHRHAEMVRDAGFSCAVTTEIGVCNAFSDKFQLPRFTPWKKTPLGFTGQMSANLLGLMRS